MSVRDELYAQAYDLYAQGVRYQDIALALNISKRQARRWVLKWAEANSLPFPIPRTNHNGQYFYDLYMNKMPVSAISKLVGVHKDKVYARLKAFAKAHGLPNPIGSGQKRAFAVKLREQGYSYSKVAKMAGYHDKSSCYRAVQAGLKERGK